MSRSVDLFIASSAPVAELAAVIAARTGLSVEGEPDGRRVVLVDGDLPAVLQEHAFVDDGDLPFGELRYVLSLRTTVAGHLGTCPETALLRRVAAALDDHRVLLVLDLQYRADAATGDAPS